MFENLRQDSVRYKSLGGWHHHPGFWLVAIYRLGVWAEAIPFLPARIAMWVIYRILRLSYRLFNLDLWAGKRGAKIGPGFCLIHPANVYIGRGVVIGAQCKLFHEVTLGTGSVPGTPRLGDNVDIFVGARILGGVQVGSDSMIGANCVVMKDVPPCSVVMAAPTKTIPRSMSARGRDLDHEVSARNGSNDDLV